MKQKIYLVATMLTASFGLQSLDMTVQETTISAQQKNIDLKISLAQSEHILKQTLSVSLDNPNASCGTITITPTASKKYLPEFSETKEILEKDVTIGIPVQTSMDQPLQTQVHVSFLLMPESTMMEKLIPLSFNQEQSSTTPATLPTHRYSGAGQIKEKKSLTDSIQDLVQNPTSSIWIRLLFAFLLGLLLSLTPCIYPMIPITIGILAHGEKKSLLQNFFGSLCYAFGVSTTFAFLGLLAAFAGASFGSLLSQPMFVVALVLFIGYMSLTMIGIVDLKIPAFLQRNTQLTSAFGPYISVFIFGLISGSVASPCVSPGLALLLTIVATMGNVFAGFLLLFLFGIGLSTPLIIIGTFSSSMNMLPRAGQWMVEVKKGLGFFMLATCLYYLNNILPATAISWILVGLILFAALFYIIDAQKDFDPKLKTIKSFIGIILLAISVVMSFKAYDQMHSIPTTTSEQGVNWEESYEQALQKAQTENKYIMLDFWAHHCTICKAIDKKIFHQNSIKNGLQEQFVFVKVDCTSSSNQEANHLKQQFQVFAQPAILIVNPNDQKVLKKWSSEPYSMTPDQFVKAAQLAVQ